MSKPSSPSRPSGLASAVLLTSSAALVALAIYQWFELLEVRAGHTPSCSINATFDCAAVWNSPFAHTVHATIGIPVAGLGVLWGLVAFVLAVIAQRGGASFIGALKVWSLAGLLSCVTFITASVQARAVCLTCLGTYGLVVAFAVGALWLLGNPKLPPSQEWLPSAGWALVLAVPVYLGLLYPGAETPQVGGPVLPRPNKPGEAVDVGAVLRAMPERERLSTAWARAQWKTSVVQDVSMFPIHLRKGSPDAPVKLVEFSDVLCGHCAQFEELYVEIERLAPPGNVSLEPRYYPLDGECNPDIKGTAGNGVRCYGARLQICSESSPKFFELRRELFENQARLDKGLMLAIATRYGLNAETLDACMRSPATAARLTEDIAYANKYSIQGTPLVLLNGKLAPPAAAFLMGMAVSGGNADAPYFLQLPPPPEE